MNIGERIKQRRKQLKLSVDDLAEKIGKNRATIYRYESNDIENAPIDIIDPLAKALNVEPSYLMGWGNQKEQLETEYTYFPVSISAGLALNVQALEQNDVDTIKIPDSLMGKWSGQSDIYVMKVNGESMNNMIPDQSLIAVKQSDLCNLKDGDVVVYSYNGEYSVKQFYQTNGDVIFKPNSNDIRFTDQVFSKDDSDLFIHGKVVVYIVELD